jgi:glutamate-1-semialdehyde 2,1-aminomutase
MELVAPAGPVYQAGTLSGNPLAMAAGIATLSELERDSVWTGAAHAAESVATMLRAAAREAGTPVTVQRVGTMLTAFFTDRPVTDWASASTSDTRAFARFFRVLLAQGVYWPPSQFEAAFLSTVHGERELETTERAVRAAMQSAANRQTLTANRQ